LSGVKSNYFFFAQVNTSIWGKNELAHKTQNIKLPIILLVWVCRDMHCHLPTLTCLC